MINDFTSSSNEETLKDNGNDNSIVSKLLSITGFMGKLSVDEINVLMQTMQEKSFATSCKESTMRELFLEETENNAEFLYAFLTKYLENNSNLIRVTLHSISSKLTLIELEKILQLIGRAKVSWLVIFFKYGCLRERLHQREERFELNYTPIINFLKTNPPLRFLEIQDRGTTYSYGKLCDVMTRYNTHLEHDVYTQFQCGENKKFMRYNLCLENIKAHIIHPNFTDLQFRGDNDFYFKLYDGHLEQLIPILANNPHVNSIDISHNNITDVGAKAIANLILQSENIKYINVSNNCIGSIGIDALQFVASIKQSKVKIDYKPQQTSVYESILDGLKGTAGLLFNATKDVLHNEEEEEILLPSARNKVKFE